MILRWSVKELVRSPARFIGSTLAVAGAFLLVTTFRAVWQGETDQLTAYLEQAGADVWVMQEHVENVHMATSFLSEGKRVEIARVEGVDAVASVLYLNTLVEVGQRSWFSYVVGIEEAGQMGGPWRMAAGTADFDHGEAVIPEVLSRLASVGIGDSIRIGDHGLRIAGLSSETFSVSNPITFVRARDLADILSLSGYDSYVLVRSSPGTPSSEVAARIVGEVDGISALTRDELIRNDVQLASQMGTELIALMTAICAVLAAILVAFALFIHVSGHRRELAVLKALGYRDRHIYGSVLLQAVVITGSAFLVASIGAWAVELAGPRIVPSLSLALTRGALANVAVAGFAVAVLSSLTVARRVARVDPLSAFRA